MSNPITVTINETEFDFSPEVSNHNDYINEMMPDNKVAPARRFLTRTVNQEQKAELVQLLDSVPGLIMDLFSVVEKESRGGVTVTLKN
ncbi:putative phage tail assembly chaperone [Vibrio quintilis]|uniref:Phage tail assembly chaperone n=1 Tax=Vibrio quintilis TaxID=1117707 RepID=A0A1M7YZ77_9VIBR|nr:putative phage tail assembly chaperone [Vibrio quintilis]SHO57895.1 hypothetical protein VQ7734_03665 [Vibrio quintilis]